MTQQLSALDASFLAIESDRNYGHTGAIAILDPSALPGGFSFDAVKALIRDRLHLIPPFTQRLQEVPLGLSRPYWVEDEHFDLDYHVRELALPAPGSMTQLVEQAGRIYSRRLDRARPLWELYVIHGLEGGRLATVTKTHHAAVDGLSGAEILSVIFDLAPEPRTVEPPDAAAPEPAPTGPQLIGRTLAAVPRYPLETAARTARLLPHLDAGLSMLGLPGTTLSSRVLSRARRVVTRDASTPVLERPAVRPPRGAYDGKVSPHRVFGLASIGLDDVKRVKAHYGVKVNDVVLALVAGVLRDDLLDRGTLPGAPLIAQVPVSVRTPEEMGTFGNRVSVMFVPIPTDLVDPVERVHQVGRTLSGAKERHGALPARALQEVTAVLPGALMSRAARAGVELTPTLGLRPPFNVIISNVPGPPVQLYSAGAKLEALFPLSIITDFAGINVTLMSYRDSIDIGITADREQTPDVQGMADRFAPALARLVGTLAP